jgi:hypothetical protein
MTINNSPIKTALPGWLPRIQKANEYLAKLSRDMGRHPQFRIDEIALMFQHPQALWTFVEKAVAEPEVVMFNTSDDNVVTGPIESKYNVSYWFLNVRDQGFRVECMHINYGFSPVHMAEIYRMQNDRDMPVAFHLSFKCNDMKEYLEVMRQMEVDELDLVQSCTSDYGSFSYFNAREQGVGLYLKPRVNVRDAIAGDGPITMNVQEQQTFSSGGSSEFGHPGVGGLGRGLDALIQKRPIKDVPQA